ncbi:MAG: DNA polymerase III subunit alpha, partial [Fimbriimonadaceae bacterium]|nr:DNA polymerase III subunit alpha [Chitinophagales bacterium]
HYPAEYMSAVLTHNQSNIDKVSFFMDECKRMGIPVLAPDVNESDFTFAVNDKGQIRFGLNAIKGVGGNAVIEIIRERKKAGNYKTIHELMRRVNQKSVNKKTLEGLVFAGALDSFGLHRAQYFATGKNDVANVIETAIRYGNNFNDNVSSVQNSLFGDTIAIEIAEPKIPDWPQWNNVEKLKKELEVIGIYLSGHPLDDYKIEAEAFKTCNVTEIDKFLDRDIHVIGYVNSSQIKTSKTGEKFCIFNIEDYAGAIECAVFGQNYLKFKNFIDEPGQVLFIKGKVQKSYRDPEKTEIRINDIELLSEVRSRKKLKAVLNMPLDNIHKDFLTEFKSILKDHPGNDSLYINVGQEAMEVHFRSKNGIVHIDSPVLNMLRKFGEVKLSVH